VDDKNDQLECRVTNFAMPWLTDVPDRDYFAPRLACRYINAWHFRPKQQRQGRRNARRGYGFCKELGKAGDLLRQYDAVSALARFLDGPLMAIVLNRLTQ
jgi:hypothetical protein